jgi:hypothetical protein
VKPYLVTITGADDSTNIHHLIALSQRFSFVEWGILVSERQEGTPRFPSRGWIDRFVSVAKGFGPLNVSTHLCGKWVRELLKGELDWEDVPGIAAVGQRVQINTHAEAHESSTAMAANMRSLLGKKFIFQWDGVNGHNAMAAKALGVDAAVLFDTSGGAGVLPDSWPRALSGIPCGYAGGLGPDNVVEQIRAIEGNACRSDPFWIDMERRVRTEDDSALDMEAVESVLKQVAVMS